MFGSGVADDMIPPYMCGVLPAFCGPIDGLYNNANSMKEGAMQVRWHVACRLAARARRISRQRNTPRIFAGCCTS